MERLGEEETETALLWQVAVEFLSCLRRWENEAVSAPGVLLTPPTMVVRGTILE